MIYPARNGQDASAAWLQVALERLLAAEHRQTRTEWTVADHGRRIESLEADARMVREAFLKVLRGLAGLAVAFGLDRALSGGALLRALGMHFGL